MNRDTAKMTMKNKDVIYGAVPKLCGWQLAFKDDRDRESNDFDNKENIMIDLFDFLNDDLSNDFFEPSGKCALCGRVYSRKGFVDGSEIITSRLISIEKVGQEYALDEEHVLLCATTASGTKYYFYDDNCTKSMSAMFEHIEKYGKLFKYRLKYLRKKEWYSFYL